MTQEKEGSPPDEWAKVDFTSLALDTDALLEGIYSELRRRGCQMFRKTVLADAIYLEGWKNVRAHISPFKRHSEESMKDDDQDRREQQPKQKERPAVAITAVHGSRMVDPQDMAPELRAIIEILRGQAPQTTLVEMVIRPLEQAAAALEKIPGILYCARCGQGTTRVEARVRRFNTNRSVCCDENLVEREYAPPIGRYQPKRP